MARACLAKREAGGGFVFLLIAEKHDLRRKPGNDNMDM